MSKQSLSPGFKESLIKVTPDTAVALATKIIEAYGVLETKYNAAQDQLESAAVLIEEQSGQIQKAKTDNPNYRPVAQIKKDHFKVNHAIRNTAGEILTVDQIAGDSKLVLKLHDEGSTAVTKLTESEIENL